MVRVKVDGVLLSIDSNRPDTHGIATWSEDTPLSAWLPLQYGMFGHRVGDNPTPMDAIAALKSASKEYQVIEGQEILDLPISELPEGAVS